MHKVNKRIFIIAGPNGAGKTTFARSFLPAEAQCQTFINADLIAAGLSPFAPEVAAIKAGKIMIKEIMAHSECGVSFAFETTFAGIGYRKHIRRWRFQGYHISLFFLALPNVEIAITRVAERVKQGGTIFRSRSYGVDLFLVCAILKKSTNMKFTLGSKLIMLAMSHKYFHGERMYYDFRYQ